MEQLIEFDKHLFYLINGVWNNALFDTILPPIRNKYFWAPLYMFIVGFSLINYKKNGFYIILGILLTFVLSDLLSSSIIKPLYGRLRPCNDLTMVDNVRLLVNCGSGFSFTSSHATNHFAISWFMIIVFMRPYKWVLPVGLIWAAAVSYAQVYVGVHFPADIMGGSIVGSLIGLLTGMTFVRHFGNLKSMD
jgi:membrane-associated phospholipid phosphatase